MTDKELKKLSRAELLEMLIEQSKRADELQAKLDKAEEELNSRQLKVDEAGSIAEASLRLNGVFEAAQAASEQYLENIRALKERQDRICAKREAESKAEAELLLAETKVACEKMRLNAKQASENYWKEVSERLEKFYEEHAGLQELLAMTMPRKEQDDAE